MHSFYHDSLLTSHFSAATATIHSKIYRPFEIKLSPKSFLTLNTWQWTCIKLSLARTESYSLSLSCSGIHSIEFVVVCLWPRITLFLLFQIYGRRTSIKQYADQWAVFERSHSPISIFCHDAVTVVNFFVSESTRSCSVILR